MKAICTSENSSFWEACAFLGFFAVAISLGCGASAASECATGAVGLPQPHELSFASVAGSCSPAAPPLDEAALRRELQPAVGMTTAEFLNRYAVAYPNQLGYNPLAARNLDRIVATSLALSDSEKQKLAQNGFVISASHQFPSYLYGYEVIYMHHLPLFISADSILEAIHRSYDDLLRLIENKYLLNELTDLLSGLRIHLKQGAPGFSPAVIADTDLFLTVALSLLQGQTQDPVAGASAQAVESLVQQAQAASGPAMLTLFGVSRDVDFSQFKPRGHYADSEPLRRYFRAVMWLGRIELPLLHPESGVLTLQRSAIEGALLFAHLSGSGCRATWHRMESVLSTFVGEPNQLTLNHVMSLFHDLGVTTPEELASRSDAEIRAALLSSKYGPPRVASQILVGGIDATAPLPRSLVLFGQRYTPDSHVFTNVTYDRVGGGRIERLMPSPLDVAFAALGNNQAGELLAPELSVFPYAQDLHGMRVLLDQHEDCYWQGNLYTAWLGALRALSPDVTATEPQRHGLPAVAGTGAWGKRMLNAQLASWAELRHDTLLYAAPSYSVQYACEFPDVYVDPYPAFYQAISRWAHAGLAAIEALGKEDLKPAADYFSQVTHVAEMLNEMAEFQRAGRPFTATQLAFVNEAVRIQHGCTSDFELGWYSKLHFDNASAEAYKPVVADVHTQPTDAAGNLVGRVLHVGTGGPRLMTVTIDTCQGPAAYVGLVASYHEQITENFQRLDDKTWSSEYWSRPPADVPWMQDLIVPKSK